MYWGEVNKCGGSSVGDADSISKLTNILISRVENHPIVVNSAFGSPVGQNITKGTDLLKDIEEALNSDDAAKAYKLKAEFVSRVNEIVNGNNLETIVDYARSESMRRENILRKLDFLIENYLNLVRSNVDQWEREQEELLVREVVRPDPAIKLLNDVLAFEKFDADNRARLKDSFLGLGELITSGLISADLIRKGHQALAIHPADAGLITDSNFQNAIPVPDYQARIRSYFSHLNSSTHGHRFIPVISGYVARDLQGNDTTLGRNSSDWSAAIFARALKIPLIIWKESDGIYDATPIKVNGGNMIPDTRTLESVSFDEALELTSFGTNAIHPKAIEEAKAGGKHLYVRNTFSPQHRGTKIVTNRIESDGLVKAITILPHVTMLDATCTNSQFAEILTYLNSKGIRFPMVSYTLGNVYMVVDMPELSDQIYEKLGSIGLAGSRLTSSKEKYLIKLVGDGIGSQANYHRILPILEKLYTVSQQQTGIYGSKSLFPIEIKHPSSIGFVTGHRAGPAIANALYDFCIRSRRV